MSFSINVEQPGLVFGARSLGGPKGLFRCQADPNDSFPNHGNPSVEI